MAIRYGQARAVPMPVKAYKRHATLGDDRDWLGTISKALAAGVSSLPAEAVADAVERAAAQCDPVWLANALQVAHEDFPP